ncbi:uroporphyrinogen-III synthase [Erythrobacter sp. SCSIO 43205]|uniref:uroporphyrinogen-III synthase n=1 Tax=Erythrobacter sp. SCSIO 43205 TaxID=2779361 RepID=UPI00210430EA|nr:uroporphyrinogen-III synthase [Erythrobacter sp. SCSIO 43205]
MILVVRPEPGLGATLGAAEDMGLNAVGYPLFEIRPVPWHCPDPAQLDALLIGSANVFRHAGEALAKLTDKPVYAVGTTTASAAREAGFEVADSGAGGLQNVLNNVPADTRLLRLAGAEHVPLEAPDGITIQTAITYEAVPLELPEPLRALQELGLTVLLHSAAAARQFDAEARRLALHRDRIQLVVIGPRVAQAAGQGWANIHVSPTPNDLAMLELARSVCI